MRVEAFPRQQKVPDLGARLAGKDDDEGIDQVEEEVAPDQRLDGPVDRASLRDYEDVQILQQD